MNTTKRSLHCPVHTNVAAAIVAALTVSLAGCNKSSKTDTTAMESTAPTAQSAAGAAVPQTAAVAHATISAKLPPLSSAMVAIVETNSSAIVEHRIHFVSTAEGSDLEKAQAMLLMFKTLNREGQRKVAHAIVRLVDDEHFFLVREQLLDTNLHPQVLSVFMTDTMKRKNEIKLPTLLEVARFDGHPGQTEAKELLHAFLGQDYQTNWTKWEDAVSDWLKNNPS